MLTADFKALVGEILVGDEPDEWLALQVASGRRVLAGIPTNDIVQFAFLVAAWIDSSDARPPADRHVSALLKAPGWYLMRLHEGGCTFYDGYSSMEWAGMYYEAGLPVEMVLTSTSSLSGMTGRGEWSPSELVALHKAGVSPEYVVGSASIECEPGALAKMFHAGVPASYALELSRRGVKTSAIREAWAAGIAAEYVVY